jgi:PmbA protein
MPSNVELKKIADRLLSLSPADQTEVLILRKDEHLTRFAANTIHQNVSESNVTVRLRVVFDKKIGVASTNDISDLSLKQLVESAQTVARCSQDNPDFISLPQPQPIQEADGYFDSTAACPPSTRATGAAAICRMSRAENLQAAGAFSTAVNEILVANSLGINSHHRGTTAHIVTVVMGDDSSGYATANSMDLNRLDPESVGRVAIDKALKSRNPQTIDPGAYDVILEPDAVASMLFALGYTGFGALAVQEGRSFMTHRFGEKITGENITIWDDGYDTQGLTMPIDYEGVPKQPVRLIENGIAQGVVYDSFTASREPGKTSTGHSLPAPNTTGPLPLNLFMAPGTVSLDEMLALTERGIWVTRFHYTNIVHPVKTVLTGMTRDGTFLIENGKVTKPLKNLRFTQSILEAFSRVVMLGEKTNLIKSDWGDFAVHAPAVKIKDFTFTGTTEF